MEIQTHQVGEVLTVALQGELDAYWAEETKQTLWACLEKGHYRLVLDLSALTYLSSMGLHILLQLHRHVKNLGGALFLAAPQPFVRKVLATSGFDRALTTFETVEEALAAAAPAEVVTEEVWATAETHLTPAGELRFRPGEKGAARLRVVGQADDFLYSRASAERMTTIGLNDLNYALGVGALGDPGPIILDRLGELLVLPGAVYWLPGDGRQVADFLIAGVEAGEGGARLPVYLLYGLSLEGASQFYGRFTAADPEAGAPLDELTRKLLDWTAGQEGYTGLVGLVLRAEVAGLWGVGLKRSPRAERAPANGQKISHRENIRDWLHFPTEPAYANHTLLAVGALVDRAQARCPADLLPAAFGTPEPGTEQGVEAHLHGAVFHFVPELGGRRRLEDEVAHVVQQGELVSVAHLLPNTRLRKAILGLTIISTLER